jgi:2'-5' RNA ligase
MRLFVGIALDETTRAAFASALEKVRPLCDAKWVKPEKAHLTLAFLGDVPLEPLSTQVREVAARHRARSMRLHRAGHFDRRVLWLGVEGDFAELHADLERTLGLKPEHEKFTAHITLARAKRPRGERAFSDCAAALENFESPPMPVDRLSLFDSRGGQYVPLLEAPLI